MHRQRRRRPLHHPTVPTPHQRGRTPHISRRRRRGPRCGQRPWTGHAAPIRCCCTGHARHSWHWERREAAVSIRRLCSLRWSPASLPTCLRWCGRAGGRTRGRMDGRAGVRFLAAHLFLTCGCYTPRRCRRHDFTAVQSAASTATAQPDCTVAPSATSGHDVPICIVSDGPRVVAGGGAPTRAH